MRHRSQSRHPQVIGLTRVRMTQIMVLRWLCPVVQEWSVVAEPIGDERERRAVVAVALD